MIKITGFALIAATFLTIPSAFAEDKTGDKASCCSQGVANKEDQRCANLASLNLNADQKGKIEAWQAECMKEGCTKESRHKFLQQSKAILSADQFAKLKEECKRAGKKAEKSET